MNCDALRKEAGRWERREEGRTVKTPFLAFKQPHNEAMHRLALIMKAKADVIEIDSEANETFDLLFYSFVNVATHNRLNYVKLSA